MQDTVLSTVPDTVTSAVQYTVLCTVQDTVLSKVQDTVSSSVPDTVLSTVQDRYLYLFRITISQDYLRYMNPIIVDDIYNPRLYMIFLSQDYV